MVNECIIKESVTELLLSRKDYYGKYTEIDIDDLVQFVLLKCSELSLDYNSLVGRDYRMLNFIVKDYYNKNSKNEPEVKIKETNGDEEKVETSDVCDKDLKIKIFAEYIKSLIPPMSWNKLEGSTDEEKALNHAIYVNAKCKKMIDVINVVKSSGAEISTVNIVDPNNLRK